MSQFSAPLVIPGNVQVSGTASLGGLSAPAGCITNSNIATPASGADGIFTTKLDHRQHIRYNQPEGTAVATETRQVFITFGAAGTIKAVNAIMKTANSGGATVTVDVKKNGTTVLGSTINVTGTSVNTGTLSVTTTAAGDVFEFLVTATAGGGTLGDGIYIEMIVDETPT